MTKRIFRSFVLLFTLVLVFASIVTSSFMYDYFQKSEEINMKEILAVAAYNVEKGDRAFLDEFYTTQYRFTLINKVGDVIYDSQFDLALEISNANVEIIDDGIRVYNNESEHFLDNNGKIITK